MHKSISSAPLPAELSIFSERTASIEASDELTLFCILPDWRHSEDVDICDGLLEAAEGLRGKLEGGNDGFDVVDSATPTMVSCPRPPNISHKSLSLFFSGIAVI